MKVGRWSDRRSTVGRTLVDVCAARVGASISQKRAQTREESRTAMLDGRTTGVQPSRRATPRDACTSLHTYSAPFLPRCLMLAQLIVSTGRVCSFTVNSHDDHHPLHQHTRLHITSINPLPGILGSINRLLKITPRFGMAAFHLHFSLGSKRERERGIESEWVKTWQHHNDASSDCVENGK